MGYGIFSQKITGIRDIKTPLMGRPFNNGQFFLLLLILRMRSQTWWRFYFRGKNLKCPKICLKINWSVLRRIMGSCSRFQARKATLYPGFESGPLEPGQERSFWELPSGDIIYSIIPLYLHFLKFSCLLLFSSITPVQNGNTE